MEKTFLFKMPLTTGLGTTNTLHAGDLSISGVASWDDMGIEVKITQVAYETTSLINLEKVYLDVTPIIQLIDPYQTSIIYTTALKTARALFGGYTQSEQEAILTDKPEKIFDGSFNAIAKIIKHPHTDLIGLNL